MIKVNVYKNEKHEFVRFVASGHAGFSDDGQDIVCAAASLLMINTINAIEKYLPDDFTMVSDDESGSIDFSLKKHPTAETTLLLKTMLLGLEEMENDENYEQYIDIIYEEV